MNVGEVWRNKKHGTLYTVVETEIINTTNERDGQEMVKYVSFSEPDGFRFVREVGEFAEKFELVRRAE